MRRTALAAPLLLLALSGCGPSVPPQSSLPTPDPPPPVSLADALESTPAVAPPMPGSEERFLRLLNVRLVPYAGVNPRSDASIVCANLASGAGWHQTVDLAPFPDLQQRRWWVLTAVEVYCPQFG